MIAAFGALLGLTGAALMAFKKPIAASLIWIPGNALLTARNLVIGELMQAALFAAYLGFAVVGLILWRRDKCKKKTTSGH